MPALLNVALTFTLCVSLAQSSHWTYTNTNSSQEKWGKVASKMCNGLKQSPIPLLYSEAFYDPNLKPITVYQLGDFAPGEQFNMTNNGHTLMVSIPSCHIFISLNGEGTGEFCVKQFHFHWGKDSSVGSEHSINGHFFPLEMHIVTYDYNYYSNFEEASKGASGLAVIALVFQIDSNIPVNQTMLFKMGAFLQKARQVKDAGSSVLLPPFPAATLLDVGSANGRYYRYEGSLTTPPCTENVYWTVISSPISVSPQQLEVMRFMHYSKEEKEEFMANNYRSLQSVNPAAVVVPRLVFRSWDPAAQIAPSIALLLVLLLPLLFGQL